MGQVGHGAFTNLVLHEYRVSMTNLTISVDADVLRRARIKAVLRNESVNSYLARVLEEYARDDREESLRRLLDAAQVSTASSGAGGRTWTREELYRV